MELCALDAELWRVASRLGVDIRLEPLSDASTERGARGGLCRAHGRWLILIDAVAPLSERVFTLARALGAFDLEAVHTLPAARDAIERARFASSSLWLAPPAPPMRFARLGLSRTRPANDLGTELGRGAREHG